MVQSPVAKNRCPDAKTKQRRGAVVVFFALMVVALLGMVAFAVDTGYIFTVDTELQRASDAGALAGAGVLVQGVDVAEAVTREYVKANIVGARDVLDSEIEVEFGHWDANSRSFAANPIQPSALRVNVVREQQPLFFARIFGRETFDVSASSVAQFRPREVMLVLDYSGSMNDDSELKSVSKLGRSTVEANIADIYAELGSPTFGNMSFGTQYISTTNTTTVLNILGLNGAAYPFPGGSWPDYVDYVKNRITSDYRRDYGYLTWVDYLQNRQPKASQTPVLWQTSEQPITALKNAVAVFLAYMEEVDTDDRIGLAVYNSTSQLGLLEHGLTDDYSTIETISRQRQAGHYDVYTNISGGLKVAREEIENNARDGAFTLIVLMTDGIANRPSDTSTAKAAVNTEAQLAADADIPVVTISLGAGADTALMQSVADVTGGKHFIVEGGQQPYEYEEDLKDVFREIADDMPLQLVQ